MRIAQAGVGVTKLFFFFACSQFNSRAFQEFAPGGASQSLTCLDIKVASHRISSAGQVG